MAIKQVVPQIDQCAKIRVSGHALQSLHESSIFPKLNHPPTFGRLNSIPAISPFYVPAFMVDALVRAKVM